MGLWQIGVEVFTRFDQVKTTILITTGPCHNLYNKCCEFKQIFEVFRKVGQHSIEVVLKPIKNFHSKFPHAHAIIIPRNGRNRIFSMFLRQLLNRMQTQ
jgi:hypothetical protein